MKWLIDKKHLDAPPKKEPVVAVVQVYETNRTSRNIVEPAYNYWKPNTAKHSPGLEAVSNFELMTRARNALRIAGYVQTAQDNADFLAGRHGEKWTKKNNNFEQSRYLTSATAAHIANEMKIGD